MRGYCCFLQWKTWVYFLIPIKSITQIPYPDVTGLSQVNTWLGALRRFKKSRLLTRICQLGGNAYNKALCLKRRGLLPCHFKHTCNDTLPIPSSQQVWTLIPVQNIWKLDARHCASEEFSSNICNNHTAVYLRSEETAFSWYSEHLFSPASSPWPSPPLFLHKVILKKSKLSFQSSQSAYHQKRTGEREERQRT